MPDWKKYVKHHAGRAIFALGLHRRLLKDRAVIVLFHRVDDRAKGNPISCTSSEFEEYCQFFGKYFDVIPLSDLVGRLKKGQDLGNRLVITFDDGYRDNLQVAGPVLSDLQLPATFFIATGFIGSSIVAPWDRDAGLASEWLSWDEVRNLAGMDFEIGAHTVNHVDLGRVHGEAARDEIVRSRQQLEHELGVPIDHFSYPFGRKDQITEANRDLVRELEFSCCLSAFGGEVRESTDLFRIPRFPVSPWYLSPYHFGWEILFGNR